MLPAPFQGHPLQKRTEVQWDMRAWLHADGGANESMSPQLGIRARIRRHRRSSARPKRIGAKGGGGSLRSALSSGTSGVLLFFCLKLVVVFLHLDSARMVQT